MTEQVETTTERRTDQINLSAGRRRRRCKSLLEQEGRDDLALRISVQPGGCSGLRYQLFFDERTLDGDVVTDFDGVTVVVDRMSVPYLNGADDRLRRHHREAGLHDRQPQRHRLLRLRRLVPLSCRTDAGHHDRPPPDPAGAFVVLGAGVSRGAGAARWRCGRRPRRPGSRACATSRG